MLSDLSGGEPSSQSLSKVRSSATTVNQWGMSHEPPPVVAQPVPAENLATSSEPEEDVPLIDGTLSRNILHLQPAPSEHHRAEVSVVNMRVIGMPMQFLQWNALCFRHCH